MERLSCLSVFSADLLLSVICTSVLDRFSSSLILSKRILLRRLFLIPGFCCNSTATTVQMNKSK